MTPDHGGALDAAVARWGGRREDWIDLSTGINPVPYPLPDLPPDAWTALPDASATARLVEAARRFWAVPDGAAILPAPGASALIARMPALTRVGTVSIPGPTYGEHAAAFRAHARRVTDGDAPARVIVHPNNPDGRLHDADAVLAAHGSLTVIDESFCDVAPGRSLIALAERPGIVVLKSFGKFWGLAGLRLGFAIGRPETLAPGHGPSLADLIGPWPVPGPALAIGAAALEDRGWADGARTRLAGDAGRLDRCLAAAAADPVGGTDLFRLHAVDDAEARADALGRRRILVRTFPYSRRWIRLGMPHPDAFGRVEAAIAAAA